ncbi:lysine-specific demethylase 2A-like, partial [Paramuricea clavata]
MEEDSGRNLRAYTRRNYDDNLDDEIEGKRTFNVLDKLADPKFRQGNFVQKLANGNDVNLKYIQEHGFDSPFLFESSEGLGMRMPSSEFTVDDVKNYVGSRRVVDVIDVNTQQQIEMSMMHFAKYYMNTERQKIYNVISLEFSHTRLENHVETPLLVSTGLFANF